MNGLAGLFIPVLCLCTSIYCMARCLIIRISRHSKIAHASKISWKRYLIAGGLFGFLAGVGFSLYAIRGGQ